MKRIRVTVTKLLNDLWISEQDIADLQESQGDGFSDYIVSLVCEDVTEFIDQATWDVKVEEVPK